PQVALHVGGQFVAVLVGQLNELLGLSLQGNRVRVGQTLRLGLLLGAFPSLVDLALDSVREALLSLLQLVLGLPVLKSALLTLSPQLLQPTLRVLQRKERALGLQGRVFLRAVGVDLGPD